MANNYLQFSGALELKNKKEVKWWEKELKRRAAKDEPWPEGVDVVTTKEGEHTVILFMAEESGDTEDLSNLIYRFMKETDSKTVFGFAWSETCSKMRVGEFGGGFAVISAADGIVIRNVHELMFQELEKQSDL